MKEKTETVLYLNIAVFVLVTGLVLRTNRLRETFQMMGIPGTSTPIVKCIGSDGVSQCRFVDTAASTSSSLVIQEVRAGSSVTTQFTCPSVYLTGKDGKATTFTPNYNPNTFSCEISDPNFPDAYSQLAKAPLTSEQLTKVNCPKADETFFPAIKKCATVVGTLPRCIPDGATVDSPEVKTAMPCYAKRNADKPEVSKFGNDLTLLWNDWINLGVYNLRNPCCDPATAPVPAGSIRIGTLVVEKDWKFWTIVGLSILVVLIIISMALR